MYIYLLKNSQIGENMERFEIIKLSKKNIPLENLQKAKKILENDYEISYGTYSGIELKKAIQETNPVIIENNLIIGYDPDGKFVNSQNEKISIERMVKAIIVESEKNIQDNHSGSTIEKTGDIFAIIGKNEIIWTEQNNLSTFMDTIGRLRIGEIFLPPHSAIFNFINPTEDIKRKKIVSMLEGANINIYHVDNFVDNAIHEIGHLFWRTSLLWEEKKKFKELFAHLKPSAIYQYEWERETEEEVFCTIYKWYVKSLLINKSFYNIINFEEPEGLKLLQSVFDRISRDRMASDIWDTYKDAIIEYVNPKYDTRTSRFIIRKDIKDEIARIELPRQVVNDISKMEDGIEYINLGKAAVPLKGNFIDYQNVHMIKLEKADGPIRPIVYVDMDGVVADFVKGYKDSFMRDAYNDDPFTINQNCMTVPNFFRQLPMVDRGKELVNELNKNYQVVFLTTPMQGMTECKRDKLEWIKKYFGDQHTVIFSDNKADYVIDEKSILIDDMKYNLDPWNEAGGTAISFNQKIQRILEIIKNVFDDAKNVAEVTDQLQTMEVNPNPTEQQKKTGNYKKGKITFKGLKIKIENPKGSFRFGKSEDGSKWFQQMKNHYGYIVHDGAAGDGDKIDCFIGPKLNASKAFIINQNNPWTGQFDEHKVMLGFETIEEAEQAYLSNYKPGWSGLNSIKSTNTKKIREWLNEGNFNEPY